MLPLDGQQIVKNLKIHIFCNALLSHWVSVANCLDQRLSNIRPVYDIETHHNKHPIREHNILEEQISQLHHFGSPKTHIVRITTDKGPTYILLA